MLSPYQGFDPSRSAQLGLEAGAFGQRERQMRQQQQQYDRSADRADAYFGLQSAQHASQVDQQKRDNAIDAFGKFNDAIVNGDDEQAAFWAQQLQGNGVGVQEYGGAGGGPASPGPPPRATGPATGTTSGNARPSAMDAYEPPGVSAAGAAAKVAGPATGATSGNARPSASIEMTPITPKEDERLAKENRARAYSTGAMDDQEARRLGVIDANGHITPEYDAIMARQNRADAEAHGLTGSSPKPRAGSFPSEVGGDKYDPKTGNKITGTPIVDPGAGVNEAEAATTPPGKGYRISIGGKTIDISPEEIRRRQVRRVEETMDGLATGASTPDEKRAAAAAKAAAIKAIPIAGVRGATKIGIDHYEAELERGGAEKRARIGAVGRGAPAAGFDKDTTQRQAGVSDDYETIVRSYENNQGIKASREGIVSSNKVMDMVKSGNSIAEWAAQQGVLKEWVRGVSSDRDLKGYLAAGGKWEQLEREFNAWFEGGRMPEDLNRKVGELAALAKAAHEKRLVDMGENAYQYVVNSGPLQARVSPEQLKRDAANIYFRLTGRQHPSMRQQGGAGKPGAAKPQGGKPAPPAAGGGKSNAQQRADALKKRLGG